ncbi:ATP-binding protein, partial [Pseudomonas aeruginosa]
EQKAIALLLKALHRDSKPQALVIYGAAGMGKSSLVKAALKANAEGYWAVGTCNSHAQAVPYTPWIEVLGALTTQLL